MTGLTPAKLSLWREGLRIFFCDWKEWRRFAAWFLIILIPIYYCMLLDVAKYGPANPVYYGRISEIIHSFRLEAKIARGAIKDSKSNDATGADDAATRAAHEHTKQLLDKLTDDLNKSAPQMQWPFISADWLEMLVIWVQLYLFYGFFMKRKLIFGDFRQSWKGFFYFLFKTVQTVLLTLLLIFLLWLALILASASLLLVAHLLPISEFAQTTASSAIALCGIVMAIVMMIYVALRFSLVFPLAASGNKTAIKTGADLMRGKVVRLCWNYIVMFFVFVFLYIFMAAVVVDFGAFAANNITLGIVIAAIFAASNILATGIYAAFKVTACRIFYQEKQLADPSFKLVA